MTTPSSDWFPTGGFWSLFRYEDVNNCVPRLPLQSDPPEHWQYRQLLVKFFRGEPIGGFEPRIAAVGNERIDTFPLHAQAESQ